MGKKIFLIFLGILLLAGSACKQEGVDIPDEVLAGLHKPVISKISPPGVLFNDAGFTLIVYGGFFEDDHYVLYINDLQIGQAVPSYWRNELGWSIPKALLNDLLAYSPSGVICSVRVTGIDQSYDISGKFEKYRDYISEPIDLEIKKGQTQFSTLKNLFPQWRHSSEPVIRCDKHGNLYLAWIEKTDGKYQAFFSFSSNGGADWSQVLNISRTQDFFLKNLGLAVDDMGHLFMVWEEASGIFFSRSLDKGATWRLPVKMNSSGEKTVEPVIDLADRGDVLLAWYRGGTEEVNNIRLVSSGDVGENWQSHDFALPNSNVSSTGLALASGKGGLLYLLSGEIGDDNKGFYFFYSHDYGVKWQVREVSTGDISPFQDSSIVRIGPDNQIYFLWGESGGWEAHQSWVHNFFLRRESSGDTWSTVQSLHGLCFTSTPKTALAISGNRVDVVLHGGGDLFLLRSSDEGRNWSYPEFIPGTDGDLDFTAPDMVLHPSGETFLIFVSWAGPESSLYMMQFQ